MRKRIFWSAYAMDRNVSLALGRPTAIKDFDINVMLPLNLTDEELSFDMAPIASPALHRENDMSSFTHIIHLRQLQSRNQDTFYPAAPSPLSEDRLDDQQSVMRAELDLWIASAPRYSRPDIATFQTNECFRSLIRIRCFYCTDHHRSYQSSASKLFRSAPTRLSA